MSDKKNLYNKLMTDYIKDIPPVTNQSKAVSVNVSFSIIALKDIDEVMGKFSVGGFFSISWYDESMVWNVTDYGYIYQLLIGYDNVWVPELILLNPTEKIKPLGTSWNKIRYHSTGVANWYPGDVIEATCVINVYNFPFDTQVCDLQMQSYGYGPTEIQLVSVRNYVDTSYLIPHSSWIVKETKAYVTLVYNSPQTVFRFYFERRPQFVIVNVILPILFMCFLNVIVFLLPVDSGERIGFAITVLLAIAVYMTIVSDNLPKTSEPLPLISYLLIIGLIVSVLITVVTVLNLRLFHKDSNDPIPKWLVRIHNILNWRFTPQNHEKKPEISRTGTETDLLSTTKMEMFGNDKSRLPSNKVDVLPQDPIDGDYTRYTALTWKHISILVDYVSLLISTSTLVISFLVIMILARNFTGND